MAHGRPIGKYWPRQYFPVGVGHFTAANGVATAYRARAGSTDSPPARAHAWRQEALANARDGARAPAATLNRAGLRPSRLAESPSNDTMIVADHRVVA